MSTFVWLGGEAGYETDYDRDANWLGGSKPTTGNDLLFDHRGQYDCLLNLDPSTMAFGTVTGTPGFKKSLGASGNAFRPDSGIGTLDWAASEGVAYFDTEIDVVNVHSANQNANALVLDSSTGGDDYQLITVTDGNVTLSATATFVTAARIEVSGGRLTIPSGVTFAGTCDVIVSGTGAIDASATCPTIKTTGGVFNLNESAAATLVECDGGVFNWASAGTITTARVGPAGQFRITKDVAKTLTTGYARGKAIVDLVLGTQLIETNHWTLYDGAVIRYPSGTKVGKY